MERYLNARATVRFAIMAGLAEHGGDRIDAEVGERVVESIIERLFNDGMMWALLAMAMLKGGRAADSQAQAMTTDSARQAAEKRLRYLLADSWYHGHKTFDEWSADAARIAADFAEKMVVARDKEWVDVVRMRRPGLPAKVTITSPLPWAEAIKEGGE